MRTAVFNWIFAKKMNGKFVLRIEDTDVERSADEHTREIIDSLHWLGIGWEGEPYYQSKRTAIYEEKITDLLAKNLVYPCFCNDEQLEMDRKAAEKKGRPPVYVGRCAKIPQDEAQKRSAVEPHSLRFRVPAETLSYTDAIRGEVTVNTGLIGDFIVRRSSGVVTYNIAASVDDAMMGISHVIRGEDHISNTPKQILMMRAMGFSGHPIYAHLPIILAEDGTKLSKRHRNSSFGDLIRDGYLPEAVFNFLALMGWRAEDNAEEMQVEKIIAEFTLERVSLRAAHYDLQKLDWLNKHHLLHADADRVLSVGRPFLKKIGPELDALPREKQLLLVSAEKENISRLDELEAGLEPFLHYSLDAEARSAMAEHQAEAVGRALLSACEIADYQSAMDDVSCAAGVKGKKLFMPVRAALLGRLKGPELKKIYEFLTPGERKSRVGTFLKLLGEK